VFTCDRFGSFWDGLANSVHQSYIMMHCDGLSVIDAVQNVNAYIIWQLNACQTLPCTNAIINVLVGNC
jgi:hypothetical protein